MSTQTPTTRILDCAVRQQGTGTVRVVTRLAGVVHHHAIARRDWDALMEARVPVDPHGEQERAPALEFGRRLFDLVLSADPNWRAADEGQPQPLCLRFLADASCVDVPWEWLARGETFLALAPGLHVCRRAVEIEDLPGAEWPAPPWRVLFASAVTGGEDIGVRGELACVLDAAKNAGREGDRPFEIDPMPVAGLQQINSRLREAKSQGRPFHLIHLAAHASRGGVIALETPLGEVEKAPAIQVAEQLGAANPCGVIVTTCWGAEAHGLAAVIARHRIPEAVGLTGEATDAHALAFVGGFYGAFGRGSFAEAVCAGRLAMHALPDENARPLATWTRAVHFQNRAWIRDDTYRKARWPLMPHRGNDRAPMQSTVINAHQSTIVTNPQVAGDLNITTGAK